jgi:hypothetical protein
VGGRQPRRPAAEYGDADVTARLDIAYHARIIASALAFRLLDEVECEQDLQRDGRLRTNAGPSGPSPDRTAGRADIGGPARNAPAPRCLCF